MCGTADTSRRSRWAQAQRWWPALLSLAILYAQSDLATVTGVVTDAAQAIVPSVGITIRNVETNIARTIQTNHEGYFTVTNPARLL